MLPSLIKILGGAFIKGESKITLTVELVKGLPKVNDNVFFADGTSTYSDGYIIEKVSETANRKQYQLVVFFDEQYPIWESYWKEFPDDQKQTAICGLTVSDFHRLTTKEKKRYFSTLFEVVGVGRIPEFLKSTMEPALKFAPANTEDVVGLTKFGGLPIAPKGFNFPKDKHGQSLLFIGQMHIGELKQRFKTSEQFKGNGILYFFGTPRIYDEKYHSFENIRVLYSEATRGLASINLPEDLRRYGTFEETRLNIMEEITIPDLDTSLWPGEKMADEESDSFREIELFCQYYNWTRTMEHLQLLGYPESIQHCVFLETEIRQTRGTWPKEDEWEQVVKAATPNTKQWKMVLMLDTNSHYFRRLSNFNGIFNEYMDGNFYVMIKKVDFDTMNFKNTVSIYQST